MNNLLFVYGSLLIAAAHPNGARLRQEALYFGPATVAGRLYRVAWNPALLAAERQDDRVHGEIYQLANPSRSLIWLDDYEGITPGGDRRDEYVRLERPMLRPDGAMVVTWVYFYQWSVDASARVLDGIWRG